MPGRVAVNSDELEAFCQRHDIRRLAFFGSVLREDFGPDSDVDVLVEFEPGEEPGLEFFRIERELGDLLGRDVDLHTPAFLSPHIRGEVLGEAEDQYVQA